MLSGVYVDIETNGGSGNRGRIIEIAAIKVQDDEIVDTFHSLVNPGGPIPHWITNLTGIESSELIHAPYFQDIAEQFRDFLGDELFIAHNVLFDYSFIRREFATIDISYTPKLFCTVKMSRALFPEHKGHSLEKIIQRHNLSPTNRHRAHDDAMMLIEYVRIAASSKGLEALQANVALQLKTKSLPPNVEEEVILSLPETPGVYIFEDEDGRPLYVGKSVNIRTRVRSHFTNATSVAKEMKMSLRSHNVTYIQTSTEIEALMLESSKIKELQPLHNRLLRRKKSQFVLVRDVRDDGYLSFTIENRDLSDATELSEVYGVFSSRTQAKSKLEEIVKTYQLCPILMGLEKGPGPCFRKQLGMCKGACTGDEPAKTYNLRVEFALERTKVQSWPYKGKVSVAISPTRELIINQWVPEAIYSQEDDSFTPVERKFDMDIYNIIRRYIRAHGPSIRLIGFEE